MKRLAVDARCASCAASSNSTSCSCIRECSQRNNDAKHSSTRRLLVWQAQGHGRKAASSYQCPILTHARSPISPPHRSLCPRVNPSTRPNLGSTTSRKVYLHTPSPASLCPRQKNEEEKRREWKRD